MRNPDNKNKFAQNESSTSIQKHGLTSSTKVFFRQKAFQFVMVSNVLLNCLLESPLDQKPEVPEILSSSDIRAVSKKVATMTLWSPDVYFCRLP